MSNIYFALVFLYFIIFFVIGEIVGKFNVILGTGELSCT